MARAMAGATARRGRVLMGLKVDSWDVLAAVQLLLMVVGGIVLYKKAVAVSDAMFTPPGPSMQADDHTAESGSDSESG